MGLVHSVARAHRSSLSRAGALSDEVSAREGRGAVAVAQSDRDAGNPDGAWYLAFIWFSGVAGGSAYGVGCRDRPIWPLIRDGLPSGSVVLTVAAMALIGAALGMAQTSALAPQGSWPAGGDGGG